MTVLSFLTPVKDLLPLVEDRMRQQAADRHPDLQRALDHIIAAGGKRVRPTVVLLVGNLLGGERNKLLTLAAAIEMLHTATLVHDDLIDGALLRRGMPTLNASWSPAATVLTGDFIFARAAKLAAETDSVAVMKEFAETLAVIVNGELTQMFDSRGLPSRENYYERIYAKTASLFELSAYAAALLSPVSDADRQKVRTFGRLIGNAFQIVDDILDFTGEQATVGKPIGSDLLQGLITLPALYYIENNPDDSRVHSLLKDGYQNQSNTKALIEAIRNSTAIQQAHAEAASMVQEAITLLGSLPDRPERYALQELAHYITNRSY